MCKKTKRVLSLLLSSVLLLGVLGACGTTQAPTAETPQAGTQAQASAPAQAQAAAQAENQDRPVTRGIVVATDMETPSLLPARHTSVHGHWKNVMTHNGLFRFAYDSVVPVLDAAYSMTPLSDTLFEFRLREGIMFHNGEEMTTDDVVASFYFVRTMPEGNAMHVSVVGIEAVDRYTFILDTGVPNAMMVGDLASQPNFIMPRSLIEAGHDFNADPVGSGPFMFREWNLGTSITLERFDNYFDTERSARVEYVEWRIIPEGASRTIALEAGEVDYITTVSFPDLPRLEAHPDITVTGIPSLTMHYLLFNHTLPQFSNLYARKAIDMALDKYSMVQVGFDGRGVPVWEQFPTMLPGISREGIRSFDPEGARTLLAEHNIDPDTLGFQMYVFNEEMRRKAEVAQANLADIGITTTIVMIDLATWLAQTSGGHHEAAFGNFTSSCIFLFLRGTMHSASRGGMNRSHMDNPEADALIERAVSSVDPDARLAILYEMTEWANHNATWAPINVGMTFRAYNANLIAPELAPVGFMFMNMMYWAE